MSVNKKIEVIFKENTTTETNVRGNELKRTFYPTERYIIDFCEGFTAEGWEQFDTDQDAHYFGFWVNKTTFQTLCYCEGDWTLCTCQDKEHYNSEIQDAINYYDEGRICLVIDEKGSTEYRQDRKEFLI